MSLRYEYLHKAKRWYDNKKKRFTASSVVPERYTFYYDSKVKKYRDTKTGKFIKSSDVIAKIENNNLGKVYIKSKNGNFYRDNKNIKRVKTRELTDKKPDKDKRKNTTIVTYQKDISKFFKPDTEFPNLFSIDGKKLIPYINEFYKINHDEKNNNARLYVYLEIEQVKEESQLYVQRFSTDYLNNENGIDKFYIEKMLQNILTKWLNYYDRSVFYGAYIKKIKANVVLKEWKSY